MKEDSRAKPEHRSLAIEKRVHQEISVHSATVEKPMYEVISDAWSFYKAHDYGKPPATVSRALSDKLSYLAAHPLPNHPDPFIRAASLQMQSLIAILESCDFPKSEQKT